MRRLLFIQASIYFLLATSFCLKGQSSDNFIDIEIPHHEDIIIGDFLPKEYEKYDILRRDRKEKPDEVIKCIGIKVGMKIGEAGAGRGYFTFHLSPIVGNEGIIYANDISERELSALTFYAKEFGLSNNIVSVLGAVDDPMFPVKDLDMIVTYKSFHDFENKTDWLINARKYLKQGGRIAIIESFNDHTKVNRRKLNRLLLSCNFKPVYHKKLYKHILVYEMI